MNTTDHFRTIFLTGERIEAICFLIIAVISILLALIFLGIIKYSFFKGLSLSFLVTGILEILKTCNVLIHLHAQQINPDHPNNSLSYLNSFINNITWYRWIEAVALLGGLILFNRFYKSQTPFWKGFGLGLIIHSIAWICFMEIAFYRTQEYIGHLSYT